MSPNRRLFLIDGSSQMYRAYHGIRGLTGPDGRSTNAVFGFITMLRKLIADEQPELIAAAFDLRGPTFRHELAVDYKANRKPMPDDLAEQIPLVHEACAAFGVPIVTHQGFEADDVMGTLAVQATAAGLDVVLVTGDKDFFQLVNDRVTIFNPRDDGVWYDAAGVQKKFGVRPDQVVDALALMGRRQRQRQGGAGHRPEGGAGPAGRVRLARPAARRGRPRCPRRSIAPRSPSTRTTRITAATSCASGPTCR